MKARDRKEEGVPKPIEKKLGGKDMVRDFEEKKVTRTRAHTVILDNRERVTITGVEDVDSFNEEEVILVTELGYITVTGQDLHITKLNLDEGQLIVEGFILGLDYSDHEDLRTKSAGLFSRIFR